MPISAFRMVNSLAKRRSSCMAVMLCALVACTLWTGPAAAADHAVVFQYHHFGSDTPPSTSVTLAQFDSHLKYLADQHFQIWPLAKIVSYLHAGKPLPERCAAITIDDAFISAYTRAFPRLKSRGWPFTVFVATDGVDQGLKGLMTWAQMREMARDGADFANHTGTHDHVIRVKPGETESQWTARVRADILHAQERLRKELKQDSRLFAYPYGEYDGRVKKLVAELGFIGFGQQSGPLWKGADWDALPRFPMSGRYADLREFAVRALSLPLPVVSAQPDDPVLPVSEARPVLRLSLAAGDYRADALACYAGADRATLRWLDREKRLLEVQTPKLLPVGRSKYTCTAPSGDGTRFNWHTQLWIRRHPDGTWYRE